MWSLSSFLGFALKSKDSADKPGIENLESGYVRQRIPEEYHIGGNQ